MTLGGYGIGTAHFDAGLVCCEHPFDAGAGGVSLSLPCADFADEPLGVVYSTVEALAAQHPDLDLDHVEPTGVLGGVVELQAAQNSPGFGRSECLIEGAHGVGRQIVLHDADASGVGIMNIDEFAHALGVILRGPPLSDLDLAPWPMHVDANEEIDGAVAAILTIVSFELAWRGGDRLTDLADELDRALVEADHRPVGIGRFGIEVEHVFHAGDIFAIDLWNAPHIPAPGLETVFGQPSAHRLARQALVPGERDHGIGQQSQRPAGATLGRAGAGRCHQQGFLLAGELALRSRTRFLAQRQFQIAFHKTPLGPVYGRAADGYGAGNFLVAAAVIGRQQYLGPLELAGGPFSLAQHRSEFRAFGLAQFDPITYIHLDLLVGSPDESTNESKIRRRS